ncbi:hypothetical protein FOA43_000411 [Brettanomyces nanus]|uniref:GATA-type domain-containing protein n=1 Tax=Eeniella nana TaxID=13502 RepID=A0A875RWA4_EENNA|nr:uncharacterized protein FOA43_000411 [Brettanomyces nanus]QPG73106.1 hypothetical protein FOA43_000411 [Brettanomyces nanus]
MSTPICKNCKTQTTPLWRRDESGQVLCNACGLFLKLHGRPRPISLKSDVIKSRNRVKHNNSKSGPNTPELKAKDSRAKFSSKQYRPKSSRSGSKRNSNGSNVTSSQSENGSNGTPHFGSMAAVTGSAAATTTGTTAGATGANMGSPANGKSPGLLPLLPRNQNGITSPVQAYAYGNTNSWVGKSQVNPTIHPLHYPSSTPAQFASNLARVTSPLLLSSTAPPKFNPSQSSERSSSQQNLGRDAILNAAGALETLSQQSSNDKIPGMRLDNKAQSANGNSGNGNGLPTPSDSAHSHTTEALPLIGYGRKPYSPSTELNGYATPPLLPTGSAKLPSLDSATTRPGMSPNFGAYQSQNTEKLPPLKNLTQNSSPLGSNPPTPNFGAQQQQQQRSQMISPMLVGSADGTRLPSLGRSPMLASFQQQQQQQQQQQTQQFQSQQNGLTSNEELRTRISELELVNDLYKTRIIELEATDNAAKQREMLLKKRIDDLTDMLRRRKEYRYSGEYAGQALQTMRGVPQISAIQAVQGKNQMSSSSKPHNQQQKPQQPQQQPQQLASPPVPQVQPQQTQQQPGGDLKRIKVEPN